MIDFDMSCRSELAPTLLAGLVLISSSLDKLSNEPAQS
jgi:hypothetical protein